MKLKVLLPSLAATIALTGYPLVVEAQVNQTKPPAQANQTKPPAQVIQSVWKPFTSTEGRFTILMPGVPRNQSQTQNSQAGPIVVKSFVVERQKDGAAYMVAYSDFPGTLAQRVKEQELLNGARDGAVKATRSQLVNQRNISLGGYPGLELELANSQGQITKNRIYLVDGRLYQVMVLTTKEKEKNLTKSIAGFFNSFRLS